eukprot:scaffold65299_cov33-Tisochrysis_lutea.AAC.5
MEQKRTKAQGPRQPAARHRDIENTNSRMETQAIETQASLGPNNYEPDSWTDRAAGDRSGPWPGMQNGGRSTGRQGRPTMAAVVDGS